MNIEAFYGLVIVWSISRNNGWTRRERTVKHALLELVRWSLSAQVWEVRSDKRF